jgi:hypothetical protein
MFAKLSIAVANIGCEGLSVTHIFILYTFYHILPCCLSHLFYGTIYVISKKSVTWLCVSSKLYYSIFGIILLQFITL